MPESPTTPALIDAQLVEQAVADLNSIYTRKGLETALEIGNYVIETFFDGDPTRYSAEESSNPSYRALAQRDDLMMSHSTLWSFVAVCLQFKALPEDVASQITYSHHRALLPLKDDVDTKEELARRAAEERLSVQQLKAAVREERERDKESTSRGRPALPIFQKATRKALKSINEALAGETPEELITRMDKQDILDLVSDLDDALDQLEKRKEAIVSALNAVSADD